MPLLTEPKPRAPLRSEGGLGVKWGGSGAIGGRGGGLGFFNSSLPRGFFVNCRKEILETEDYRYKNTEY